MITLSAIMLLLPSSILAIQPKQPTTDSPCYGFLIPLPSGTDTTPETILTSKVRHLINDLLRENITVYWSDTNFSALSKKMDNQSIFEILTYKKGTYFIPFPPDTQAAALIASIIYDYNQTSEIDTNSTLHVPTYKLMTPLTLSANPLVEPKIAQHLGTPTRYGWPCYLQIADAGGFYSMEFLLDNETSTLLNNKDFNVFMWPYNPNPGTVFEQLKSLTNKEGNNAVRQFVKNGGGYIGSCYGALAASSGILRPIPVITLRSSYNPNLPYHSPSIGLSLTDTIMDRKPAVEETLYTATSTITNTNHPITYGINTTIQEFFKGPWFAWLGKNTEQIACFQTLTVREGNNKTLKSAELSVIGTPSWVSSHFGKGHIILFSSHPEFINNISLLFEERYWKGDPYYGRRVIHNSLFYVTAKPIKTITATQSFPLSLIEDNGEKTTNLPFADYPANTFYKLQQRITKLDENFSSFQDTIRELARLSSDLINTSVLWINGVRMNLYPFHFCEVYREYGQKTQTSLQTLEKILPLFDGENNSTNRQIERLTDKLLLRLNHSDTLMKQVNHIAQTLITLLKQSKPTLLQQLQIIKVSRELLSTFEIGLKYIPQLFFESQKTLQHLWYTYEAFQATTG